MFRLSLRLRLRRTYVYIYTRIRIYICIYVYIGSPTFNVVNPARLPEFLESFPPPVRERLRATYS